MTTESSSRRHRLICHVIFRLDFGGLENGLVNLINRLPADEFSHAIVCLTHATAFRERIIRSDVQVFELHKRPGKDIGIYPRMWRLLRQLRPDIVHTRNLPALDSLFTAKLAGVRTIHGEHGLDLMELHGRHAKYNRLRQLTRLVTSTYVAVSADLARWLHSEIGIPKNRIRLIYNGVDSDKFHPGSCREILPAGFAPSGAFVIGAMGRLEPVKDQVTLAKAFCHMLELRPELKASARLVIVGDGVLRQPIEDILSSAGLRQLAWLPGFRNDSAELYRAFDLFVLPSLREGISNTLLESMATGIPVVATAVGGTAEILLDGVTGALVPPHEPENLAAAMLAYYDDRQRTRLHGEAARARILQNFSLTSMVESYRQLYACD